MATRRIQTTPRIRDFSANTLKELATKTQRGFESLYAALGQALGLLKVVDRNTGKDYPETDTLGLEGTAVSVSKVRTGYITASIGYTGVDGIDTEQGKVRCSRDFNESSTAISGTNQVPDPTGWDTLDYFRFSGTSSPTVAGFPAPTSDGTRHKKCMHVGGTPVTFTNGNTAASVGERLWTPGEESFDIGAGDSFDIDYEDVGGVTVWRVSNISRPQVTVVDDHGALTGLADDDHTQYLLVNGTRALGGNWSLGNFDLSNANIVTFNGSGSAIEALDELSMHDTGSFIDMRQGDIIDVDNITNTTADLDVATTDGNVGISAGGTSRNLLLSATGETDVTSATLDVNTTGLQTFDTTDGNINMTVAGTGRNLNLTSTNNSVLVTAAAEIDLTAATLDLNSSGAASLDATGGNINIVSSNGSNRIRLASAAEILLAPTTFVDFNDTPARNVNNVRFDDYGVVQSDASGAEDAFSVQDGVPFVATSSSFGYVIDYPVHVQYGNATEGSTQSVNIDTSSICGKDLSNGNIEFYSVFYYIQSGTGDDSYSERCYYNYYRAKDTGSASITNGSSSYGARVQNWALGSFSHQNVLTISGTNDEIITFQIVLPGASGTGRLLWVIRATGIGS